MKMKFVITIVGVLFLMVACAPSGPPSALKVEQITII